MHLAPPEFQRFIQIVMRLPGWSVAAQRRQWCELAFAGQPAATAILGLINLDGPPLLVATEVVRRLCDYGRIDDGRPALVVLAQAVQPYAGEDDRAFLAAVIARAGGSLAPSIGASSPASGTSGGSAESGRGSPPPPLGAAAADCGAAPQPLSTADRERLATLFARVASTAPGLLPQDVFRDLVSRAELPETWRQQLAGTWSGNAPADARRLIIWAQGKGANPAQPQWTTLGSLLLPLIAADDLGVEDRHTVINLIRHYHLCSAPALAPREG